MYIKALSVLALVGAAQAHMSMYYPAPLGGAPGINRQSKALDPEFNFPLGCCGPDGGDSRPSPGICRGHLDKYDTEKASVTWKPGQDAHFQLTNYDYDPQAPGGTHSGGSCQVGFSLDKGKTWKMAASYHGACPHATEDGSPEAQTFDFKVPTGMPAGDALFGWVWLNREHEAFMNCAKVNIAADSSTEPSKPSQSATQPKPPAYSATKPDPPAYSPAKPKETPAPQVPQPQVDPPNNQQPPVVTVTTVVATTIYQAYEPSAIPTSEAEQPDNSYGDSQKWGRPHPEVKPNTRRYDVDGSRCDCRRDELTLAARCFCNSPDKAIERKALRLHRRTFYRRTDACDWKTAPKMEVSYYTTDAKCAAGAKDRVPESDNFELAWDVNCGVVAGISDYEIKTFTCDMYG
ncbi:hypothetical protein P3342_006526 [Pyrenophora teres f. teres]|uniref:Lytic polysaccharide monooxygenase n=1 Tax=Pyrenophora teres f. teres TaxID=97479 RepID=A0A6S6VZZ3_9PLEO|nr:hypothetical protein HRS9139_05105 [Pyrenophora teres f. teres]CAA9960962.1 Lytic polysaccharide monooxygenase [Pyrenophora teres f. maculata]KAE8864441.1 hypothetical protein PTNB29_04405 [Pyrenophora teres f. teres]KAE8867230.1 hypothetical protein PTNB73_05324 [Pyrenophora teres f. teres]KAK1910253.1 hypothetical protein P3342_006526 [Pyrenophora teres f. teres]